MARIDDTNLAHLWKKIVAYVNSRTGIKEQNFLWSGSDQMLRSQTITLSQRISEQPNGVEFVFSRFDNTNQVALNDDFISFTIHKKIISTKEGKGHSFLLTDANFRYIGAKYLEIYDDKIIGFGGNTGTGETNGINYQNNCWVLRYVIGV